MTERPLLMKGRLVLATMEGRKTVTRRIVDMDRLRVVPRRDVRGDYPFDREAPFLKGGVAARARLNPQGAVSGLTKTGFWLGLKPGEFDFVCPYTDGETRLYGEGDKGRPWEVAPHPNQFLYVRETCMRVGFHCEPGMAEGLQYVRYKADGRELHVKLDRGELRAAHRWVPSIHMPKAFSRVLLYVLNVRLERLSAITAADTLAEGLDGGVMGFTHDQTISAFRDLWNDINAARGYPWESDCWVWRIKYGVARKNAVHGEQLLLNV